MEFNSITTSYPQYLLLFLPIFCAKNSSLRCLRLVFLHTYILNNGCPTFCHQMLLLFTSCYRLGWRLQVRQISVIILISTLANSLGHLLILCRPLVQRIKILVANHLLVTWWTHVLRNYLVVARIAAKTRIRVSERD